MDEPNRSSQSFVRVLQFSILAVFLVYSAAVLGWIVHLVRLSYVLNDVPDASMAVSLVAVPVFLCLAFVLAYVIGGLVLDPEARASEPGKERS